MSHALDFIWNKAKYVYESVTEFAYNTIEKSVKYYRYMNLNIPSGESLNLDGDTSFRLVRSCKFRRNLKFTDMWEQVPGSFDSSFCKIDEMMVYPPSRITVKKIVVNNHRYYALAFIDQHTQIFDVASFYNSFNPLVVRRDGVVGTPMDSFFADMTNRF